MNIIMKPNKILAWAFAVALSCSFAACSDDVESLLRPAVDIESTQTSVSSLTFWWPDRGDAVSWHYVFKNEAGEVLSEADLPVDHSRRLVFTGLKPDSNYTLEVTAIDADGNTATTSYTARTAAVVTLSTPTVAFEQEADTVKLSWATVTNAASYGYQIVNADGDVVSEGQTASTGVNIGGLAIGDYTANVTALTGGEAYSDSEAGTLAFTRSLGRMVTSPGTYTLADGTVVHPALIYMEDGSYLIENFRGVAGYDLTFTVKSGKVTITNGTALSSTTTAVETGAGTVTYTQNVRFSGNEYEGSITFTTDLGTETFTWEALVVPDFSVTLYGCIYMSGYSSNYSDYFDIPAEARNGVITIESFLGSKNTVTLTYDREAGTATCDLNVGWNVGYFYIGDFPSLYYIYFPGSIYCYYDSDYDCITIECYAYTSTSTYYWSALEIYIDELE
jgi:hypothetical protein